MSDMSFIAKLLDGVDVEWKALGEVCDFKNGFAFKSSLFKEAGLPIIRITNVDGKNISLADVKYFDPSDYKENTASYEVSKGDILIAMSGATTGKIGFYAHENPAYLNQRVGKFLPKPKILNNRYLYHYLLSQVEQIYVIAGGGAQPNLSSNALMAKIELPIPSPEKPKKSLEIQAEIVRILDTFTELTTELTAELSMRKKQYNFYRDKLLGFEEGKVEWKPLSEIFNTKNGYTPSKSKKEFWESGSVPWFRMDDIRKNGQILDDSLQKVSAAAAKGGRLFPANSIIIATSATIGEHALITVPYLANQRFTCLNVKEKYSGQFEIKFLFYYCFILADWCKKNTTTSSFASVDMDGFKKFQIPIPSIEEQLRIVTTLEKFDTLTSSISEGLPREIKLRQKQYEYYRDLLLSFPKPEEVAV